MSYSRYSGGSSLLGEKEEFPNYYDKKPLRCYHCGEVGHIKRYCQAKESNMTQKVAEEEEEWGKCLVAEARAIYAMISINLEKDWIEDLEYNIADHVEKQETDVVGMKQEFFENVLSGDRVATIEEIKEVDYEQAVSETIYVSGDLHREIINKGLLEAEVSSQSFAISRLITSLEKILEANGDDEYQIDKEVDLEDQISCGERVDITIGSSENEKYFIKELRRKCGGGSCASDEAVTSDNLK
ncbi:hypothetical protein KY290_005508 [Solanum tuberosum]|uniref:CCHC-type domain-containing protein n=1 Tax=Solanum tuberosum TaxID=4113 RepID=A0ABQ7WEC5_SOLTU|nr:hypothetical protein KY289_005893 [Solanum tuberosum]KAH0779081.1 hypothetical protein KY290_005508 [Solanum tuberosum]